MKVLITKSLTSTRIACTVERPGIGTHQGVLCRHHRMGYVTLEIHIGNRKREYDIVSGETHMSDSGIYITKLVSDKGYTFYAQSAAGDVWRAVHDMPKAVASPEVESIQQAIA